MSANIDSDGERVKAGQHAVSREAAIAVRSLLDYHGKDEKNAK